MIVFIAKEAKVNEKKLDWHLFWTAAGVVVTLATIIIGCYINLISKIEKCRTDLSHEISMVNTEIVKIQTVMIIKQLAPAELFASSEDE